MKKQFLAIFFVIIFLFAVFGVVGNSKAAGDENVIFLHHSTGNNLFYTGGVSNWISNYNSANGTTYQITERPYPTTPYPWDNYPYDYWNLWVNGACNSADPDIECLDTISNAYDVVVFKHCYPGAGIQADTGSPSVSSATKSLENYKLQYRALRDLLDTMPDTKFIIWTLVPLHRLATNSLQAARAEEFVNWVKNDFLTENGSHPNIYIFDFWEYAAEHEEAPAQGQKNTLKYKYEISHTGSDSHPNTQANIDIGPIFSQFVVDTIEGGDDTTPPSHPTGLSVE